MKNLIFILLLFTGLASLGQSPGNNLNKYIHSPNQYGIWHNRVKADSVNDIPQDTTHSKDGIARKGNRFFVGNGVFWREIFPSSSSVTYGVDSITYSTNLLCQWKNGISTCYSIIGGGGVDSVTLVGDQLCQFKSGVSTCYTITDGILGTFLDSVVVTGNQLCQWKGGVSTCYTINNVNNGIDSVTVVNGQLCSWKGGVSTCYTLPFAAPGVDSVVIRGGIMCVWTEGSANCFDLDLYHARATLNFDSSWILFYNLKGQLLGDSIRLPLLKVRGTYPQIITQSGDTATWSLAQSWIDSAIYTPTLQQSFDKAPTANPQININGNDFVLSNAGSYDLLTGTNPSVSGSFGEWNLYPDFGSMSIYSDTTLTGFGMSTNGDATNTNLVSQITENGITNNQRFSVYPKVVKVEGQLGSGNNHAKLMLEKADTLLTTPSFIWAADGDTLKKYAYSPGGGGSVTSVATGLGLSGGTITGAGTLLVDTSSASILSRQRAALSYAPASDYTDFKTRFYNKTTDTQIDIFIVAGQSQAAGRGDYTLAPSVSTSEGLIWENTSFQVFAEPWDGLFAGVSTGSPWSQFAKTYFAKTGRLSAYVNVAKGGTAVSNWISGAADQTSAIAYAQKAIDSARLHYDTVNVAGVLWIQGETDAQTLGTSKTSYKTSLASMIGSYRTGLGKTDLPLFIFELGVDSTTGETAPWTAIRQAQNEYVDSNAYANMIFKGAKYFRAQGLMVDEYHYTQPAYNVMGDTGAVNVSKYNSLYATKKDLKFTTASALAASTAGLSAKWGTSGNAITFGNYLGTSNSNSLRLKVNGVELMTLDSNSRVGISNTVPTYKLDVFDASNTFISASGNNNVGYLATTYNATPGTTVRLQSALGTKASPTILTNGKYLGYLMWDGYTGAAMYNAASITTMANGTWVQAGAKSVRMDINLSNVAGSAAAPVMSLLTGGTIGVGTTAPIGQFHLVDEAATAGRGLTISEHQTSTASPLFAFLKSRGTYASPTAVTSADFLGVLDFRPYVGATNGYIIGSRIDAQVFGTVADLASGASTNLKFSTRNRVGFAERWRIDTLGNFSNLVADGTAGITLKASTATAGTGQLKFITGTAPTVVEPGLVNYTSPNLTFDDGTTRYTLAKTLTATATLDFPSTATGIAADLTITVTGAAVGDAVNIGVPNGSVTATGQYFGWVSATNTVTIRFIPHATEDPASGTFRASVIKY